MAEELPGLTATYIGPNTSHRQFRVAIANAKALAYVLAHNDARVLRSFQAEVEEARKKSRDGTFAIGMVGRATTTTVQMAIHITGKEADLIAAEPGGFVSQALSLLYREVYRVFETILVDLFEEIALKDKRVLYSSQKMTHEEALRAAGPEVVRRIVIDQRKSKLTRVDLASIEKAYSEFGLLVISMNEPPALVEQQDVQRRLHLLSALLNIIEHNRSIVNQECLALVPTSPYKLGERVVISTPELGDALSAIELTADHLNTRAIAKFALA